MLLRGLKKYFTAIPCKKGHIAERWYDGHCVECHAIHMVQSFQKSKDAKKEKRLAAIKNWRLNNPSRHKAVHNNSNILRKNAIKNQKITRTYMKELRLFYFHCPTGHQVDHIIPIKNKIVCGLHVPWNLQYLLANENARKGNSFHG